MWGVTNNFVNPVEKAIEDEAELVIAFLNFGALLKKMLGAAGGKIDGFRDRNEPGRGCGSEYRRIALMLRCLGSWCREV